MSNTGGCGIARRYKCHKSCNESGSAIYDKSTIQKLTEVFSFDYSKNKNNASVIPAGKGSMSHSSSTYRCYHSECDSQSEDFTYAPLESFRSPTYPLSLPPPRSDDDIQPVSSNQDQTRLRRSESVFSQLLDVQHHLLLHDLFSGDIYDS